jgi:hypothetical protein
MLRQQQAISSRIGIAGTFPWDAGVCIGRLSTRVCSMSRFVSVVILAVAFVTLCRCNSSSAPPVMSPPLPLANRIQPPDPSKYATFGDVPWNEWKNPRVIVTSEGIKVLLSDKPNGSTVPPERVGDVLAKTTSSDWPLGLIVMAEYGFDDHQMGDHQKVDRNAVELSNTLSNLGIHIVWGPPSA